MSIVLLLRFPSCFKLWTKDKVLVAEKTGTEVGIRKSNKELSDSLGAKPVSTACYSLIFNDGTR